MTDTRAADEWGAVATAWDAFVDEVDGDTATATARLLERLAVRPGDAVLELAAGPGSMGATWRSLVGDTGRVLLTDVAPAMVEVARRRNAGSSIVDVVVVDASAIDQPDTSFDVVASRMGLMFTPDPGTALTEMRRVLGTGGRMASLVWGGLEHNPWVTCVGMAAAMHGVVAGGPPVAPGGLFSLGDPAHLAGLAVDAGFEQVEVDTIDLSFRARNIHDHVTRVAALAGPLAAAIAAAPADQQAAVRHTAAELAAPYASENGFDLPGRALLVSGRR